MRAHQVLATKRQQEIEAEQATDISASWYMMVWSYCVQMAAAVQEAFQSTPSLNALHPDNPGTRGIFSHAGSVVLPTLAKIISPIALAGSWLNAIQAVRNFRKKEHKTIGDYANVIFSCAAPTIWTALYIAGVSVSAAALMPVLPWITAVVFGAFALHGVVRCVTNCYRAWKAHRAGNKDERNEYLKQAGKNLLGIVFNTLALAVSIVLGIKMSEATGKIADGLAYFQKTFQLSRLTDALNSVTDLFVTGCKLIGAMTAFAVLGMMAHAKRMVADVKVAFNWMKEKSKASPAPVASVESSNGLINAGLPVIEGAVATSAQVENVNEGAVVYARMFRSKSDASKTVVPSQGMVRDRRLSA